MNNEHVKRCVEISGNKISISHDTNSVAAIGCVWSNSTYQLKWSPLFKQKQNNKNGTGPSCRCDGMDKGCEYVLDDMRKGFGSGLMFTGSGSILLGSEMEWNVFFLDRIQTRLLSWKSYDDFWYEIVAFFLFWRSLVIIFNFLLINKS